MSKLVNYGESMYGGWYANFYVQDNFHSYHYKTLDELKNDLAIMQIEFDASLKYDN